MSLENEYFITRAESKNEIALLKQFQEQDITKMSSEQLEAYDRGIKSIEKDIVETDKILDEIKVELYDFIYNGGEVSKKTIETLLMDFTQDILFKQYEDDYDLEVLNGKQDFLKSLL